MWTYFFYWSLVVVFVEIHRSSPTNQNFFYRFYVTPEVLAVCMLSSYLKICHRVPVEQHWPQRKGQTQVEVICSVAKNFCGSSLFSHQRFYGNLFLRLWKTGFPWWVLISAIFRKSRLIWIPFLGFWFFLNLTALMKSTNEQHEEMHNPVIGITLFHLAIALDINQQKTTIPLDAYSLILFLPER